MKSVLFKEKLLACALGVWVLTTPNGHLSIYTYGADEASDVLLTPLSGRFGYALSGGPYGLVGSLTKDYLSSGNWRLEGTLTFPTTGYSVAVDFEIARSLSQKVHITTHVYPPASGSNVAQVVTKTGISADIPAANEAIFTFMTSVASIIVPDFTINDGAATTTHPMVTLNNKCEGTPTEYMASERSDFSDTDWRAYATEPSFTLSANTVGRKTVYFKVRNAALVESNVAIATIDFVEQTILLPGGVPLSLRWIPSGSYQMGRYHVEQDISTSVDAQHLVTLAYGFWMGKYEITQQQWLAVMGSWPGMAPSSSFGLGDAYPAYFISWNDAKDFIATLNSYIVSSGQGPLTVRLPSEAEWEYVCRAGMSERFCYAPSLRSTVDCEACSYVSGLHIRMEYMWCGCSNLNSSMPVDEQLQNPFGMYHINSNVREWCEDDWHPTYNGAPQDGSAWIDSPRALERVVRGGGWVEPDNFCRSACRIDFSPSLRSHYIGFRLAAGQ